MACPGTALLVRYFSGKAYQVVRDSTPHYPHHALNGVLLGADRDAYHLHLSFFSTTDVDTFRERGIFGRQDFSLRGRGVPLRGKAVSFRG